MGQTTGPVPWKREADAAVSDRPRPMPSGALSVWLHPDDFL